MLSCLLFTACLGALGAAKSGSERAVDHPARSGFATLNDSPSACPLGASCTPTGVTQCSEAPVIDVTWGASTTYAFETTTANPLQSVTDCRDVRYATYAIVRVGATSCGQLTVSTDTDYTRSGIGDSYLAAFGPVTSGQACATTLAGTPVECDDDGGSGYTSRLSLDASSAGVKEFLIVIGGYRGSGGIGLTVSVPTTNCPCADGLVCDEDGSTTLCPAGSYCTSGAVNTCPAGSYCPTGSISATPCPAATFSDVEGATSNSTCSPCPAGSFCPQGSASNVQCPAGSFCPAGSASATPCTAGSFCPAGSEAETPCPAASFCPAGAASSVLCPAGSFCPAGSTSFTPCPAGTFSNVAGASSNTTCSPCAAGSFSESAGATSCTQCPEGSFCPTGSTSSTACPAGTFSSVAGASSNATCAPCPGGSFSESTGATSCEQCPEGSFCLAGSTSSTLCPTGSYCPASSAAPITPCPANVYCSVASVTQCSDAPTIDIASGVSTSYAFETTTANPLQTVTDCRDVRYATYAIVRVDATSCGHLTVSTDTDRTRSGLTDTYLAAFGPLTPDQACATTLAGTPAGCNDDGGSGYTSRLSLDASSAGVKEFLIVLGGYNSNGKVGLTVSLSTSSCPCADGFVCEGDGDTTPCPAGSYCVAGAVTTCPAGSYCPTGSISATPCPAATFSDVEGATSNSTCSPCPAGSYCPQGSASGAQCPAGTFCPAGSASVTPCSAGSFCPAGSGAETPCSAGYLCPPGSASGTQCPEGSFCPAGSASSTPCPAGTSSSVAGASSNATCAPCPGGSFSESTGATSCEQCPEGSFCPAGSTSSTLCPAGSYCPASSAAPITPCPANVYCTAASVTHCSDAPTIDITSGVSTSYALQTSSANPLQTVTDCRDVRFATYMIVRVGAASCGQLTVSTDTDRTRSGLADTYLAAFGPLTSGQACTTTLAGTPAGCNDDGGSGYSSVLSLNASRSDVTEFLIVLGGYNGNGEIGLTVSLSSSGCPCADGFVCEEGEGATPCPAGSFCVAGIVTACPAGSYCPAGSSAATPCPAGSFCPAASDSEKPCPAGSFCPPSSLAPTPCSAGSFSEATSAVDSSTCEACPAGSYCPTGSTSTTPCPAGSFCPAGSGSATPCPAGLFCPTNSASGTPCPAAFYCPTGSNSTTPCPAGSFCPAGSAAAISCPAGSFCPANSASPVACPNGTFSNAVGAASSSMCAQCPAGSFCSGGVATLCPAGTFSDTAGASLSSTCEQCSAGTYCPEGSTWASPCPAGAYCPPSSSSATLCPGGTFSGAVSASSSSTCAACPAGSYCPEGSAWTSSCPAGSYCPPSSPSPTPCSGGSFSEATDASSSSTCSPCPVGSFCPEGSSFATSCAAGSYCPAGSASSTSCPSGSFCRDPAELPVACPPNTACPRGSVEPLTCEKGFRAPHSSASCIACQDTSQFEATNDGESCYFQSTLGAPLLPVLVIGGALVFAMLALSAAGLDWSDTLMLCLVMANTASAVLYVSTQPFVDSVLHGLAVIFLVLPWLAMNWSLRPQVRGRQADWLDVHGRWEGTRLGCCSAAFAAYKAELHQLRNPPMPRAWLAAGGLRCIVAGIACLVLAPLWLVCQLALFVLAPILPVLVRGVYGQVLIVTKLVSVNAVSSHWLPWWREERFTTIVSSRVFAKLLYIDVALGTIPQLVIQLANNADQWSLFAYASIVLGVAVVLRTVWVLVRHMSSRCGKVLQSRRAWLAEPLEAPFLVSVSDSEAAKDDVPDEGLDIEMDPACTFGEAAPREGEIEMGADLELGGEGDGEDVNGAQSREGYVTAA